MLMKKDLKSASNKGRIYLLAGLGSLMTCLPYASVYADREFTATAQEHIPAAIQQIAQVTAKSISPEDMSQDQMVKEQHQEKTVDAGMVSEAFGHLIVKNLESPGFKFDMERVMKGMKDEIEGKPSPLTAEEYEQAVMGIQEKVFSDLSEENLKEADAFMKQNANAEGVIEIVPGKLQYKIIEEGTGPAVQPHSTPQIHYTGKYIDGTVFGSSKELGEPISLPLDQTIVGFGKGLIGMKEGEKRILYIHPDLGYGTMGQLPPNSMLIFEVDLVKANTQPEAKQPPELPAEPQHAAAPEPQEKAPAPSNR